MDKGPGATPVAGRVSFAGSTPVTEPLPPAKRSGATPVSGRVGFALGTPTPTRMATPKLAPAASHTRTLTLLKPTPMTKLGIAFESEENESPVVVSVEPTGAGYGVMQLGDVIIQVDGRPARGHEATSAQLCGIVGEFEVEVRRKGPAPPPSPDTTESDED